MLGGAREDVHSLIDALIHGHLAVGVRPHPSQPSQLMSHQGSCDPGGDCKVVSSLTTSEVAWAGRLGRCYEAMLFSRSECEHLIDAAERAACWRLRGEYEGTTTRDVDACSLTEVWPWLSKCATHAWQPLLASLFGGSVVLETLRIVKYTANDERARGIGLHSDGSVLSFVCTLSDSFEGGGTYMRALSRVLRPPVGAASLFCGRWVHEGVPVSTGVRYVLTAFFAAASADSALTTTADLIQRMEAIASIAPRLCPNGRNLRRCYRTGVGDGWQCAACGVHPPVDGVLHLCTPAEEAGSGEVCDCGGTTWCNACLAHAQSGLGFEWAAMRHNSHLGADEGCCEFLTDQTLPDGTILDAGSTAVKVWRLRLLEPSPVPETHGNVPITSRDQCSLRLVRDDIDSDERIGSRCLGGGAFTWLAADGDNAALYDVAVRITAPLVAGPFRAYWRIVCAEGQGGIADNASSGESGPRRRWLPIGDRLWADFTVAATEAG